MNWFKENWFKAIISFSALVFAVSFSVNVYLDYKLSRDNLKFRAFDLVTEHPALQNTLFGKNEGGAFKEFYWGIFK